MNIVDLNDYELEIFLKEGISYDNLRKIYKENNKLAQQIHGFRCDKAPEKILLKTTVKLIKKDKNRMLIKNLQNFYDNFKKNIKLLETELMKKGYPYNIAQAMAIKNNNNLSFLPIYYKLEEINNETQNKINEDIEKINTYTCIINDMLEHQIFDIKNLFNNENRKKVQEINNKLDKKFYELNNQISNNLKIIQNMQEKMLNYKEIVEKMQDEIFDNCKAITNIKNDKSLIQKTTLQRSNIINDIDEKINKNVKNYNKSFKKIENSINNLYNELAIMRSNVKISKVSNNKYTIENGDLNIVIGDIIEDIATKKTFDVFREYLKEIIFSQKPIICTRNNVGIINVIASILSGGNYYEIESKVDCSDEEIINILKDKNFEEENKVIIFKNYIDATCHSSLIEFIKNRPFYEKYVFLIDYDKEVIFMPIEVLETFNFFMGSIQHKNIDNKYYYQFEKKSINLNSNNEYTQFLKSLGVNLNDYRIYNNNYVGLLIYSIIPFLQIHSQLDKKDIINKIFDEKIRKICEDFYNE